MIWLKQPLNDLNTAYENIILIDFNIERNQAKMSDFLNTHKKIFFKYTQKSRQVENLTRIQNNLPVLI